MIVIAKRAHAGRLQLSNLAALRRFRKNATFDTLNEYQTHRNIPVWPSEPEQRTI